MNNEKTTFGNGDEILSFLMIGQSNMAGRGDVSDIAPIESDSLLVLRMGRWQQMRRPVNPDRGAFTGFFKSGVCLAESFAQGLQKHTGAKIGLIPCADGGTCLDEWVKGSLLFDHAVAMARLAMRTSRLSGIIWHQGESDAREAEKVSEYKEKFIKMINDLRSELKLPTLPVVIGELSHDLGENALSWRFENRHLELNRILNKIPSELEWCRIAHSDGLDLMSDGLHFDSRSLYILGERYFNEMKILLEGDKNE
ncbi:MAG: sialate O-acetylesterase [Clostridia bacterium]|nr:sialate O-acetylesterase [Clostridia bacterium]